MVQIDEYQRKLVVVPLRAINLRLQDVAHVSRVVERRAIISDGQVVNFLDVAGVLERDGGKIRERFEEFQIPRIEPARQRWTASRSWSFRRLWRRTVCLWRYRVPPPFRHAGLPSPQCLDPF